MTQKTKNRNLLYFRPMTRKEKRNNALQALCREYLTKLKGVAKKHGLDNFVSDIIASNKRKECVATEKEVHLLARAVNEERVARLDVPKILGLSYRQCVDMEIFDKVKNLGHIGTYSKPSVMMLKKEIS